MAPVPTRRLALVALAAAVASVFMPEELSIGIWGDLLRLNAIVAFVALIDWLFAPPSRKIRVERATPAIIALGGRATMTWIMRNTTSRPCKVHLADELAPSLRAEVRRVSVSLPARGRAEVRTILRPARRGRFRLRRVTVRVEGPLGLMARQGDLGVPGEIRVYPSFRSKDEAEQLITRARVLEIGMRSARGLGGGTEFEQLREYSPDDESRRIDWSATARSGKVIVRTYRAERNQTVLLLLDNGRVMAGRVDGVPRAEHAMDAIMAATTVATALGDRCGLLAFDSTVRAMVPPARHRGQVGRITEAMYRLQPELAESDYQGAFTQTLARFRRRAFLVLLTDLVEQAVGESLLPALPLLTRSHLLVIAAVRDPDVEAWARSVPADPEEAYRKAAAVGALAERDRVAARLRGLGVTVLDVPPGKLAARLCDTYLKVKATGRL